LAAHFALPLVTKDTIKEMLFDTLGWRDRAWSKQLGGASMELLYRFAEAQVASRRSCIVEANFHTAFATPVFRHLKARYPFLPIQVNFVADPAVLVARFRQRALSGERHPGHQDHLPPDPRLDQPIPGRMEPLDISGHVIELDTTNFARVDYDHICAQVDRLWHQR
jgi:hypothetical protein